MTSASTREVCIISPLQSVSLGLREREDAAQEILWDTFTTQNWALLTNVPASGESFAIEVQFKLLRGGTVYFCAEQDGKLVALPEESEAQKWFVEYKTGEGEDVCVIYHIDRAGQNRYWTAPESAETQVEVTESDKTRWVCKRS